MQGYLLVFIGAGVGGTIRHVFNSIALRMLGSGFPWGTFAVNVLGSFLMGLIAGWFALRADPGQHWKAIPHHRSPWRFYDFFNLLA